MSIESLYEQVAARTAQPHNQAKKDLPLPRFYCYLENLGWIQLLHFDFLRSLEDADYACEIQFDLKLRHMDMFDDDSCFDTAVGASIGMYFEFPLIGIGVGHQLDGVPVFQDDHPLRRHADLSLLKPHDFFTGGDMPKLLRMYERMRQISRGRFPVHFTTWGRGPLDMAIGLRGYEQFIEDTLERPQFVHDLMRYLITERMRWWEAYCRWSGQTDKARSIEDDWINIPFITPTMFEEFCLPYYLELEKFHGTITNVHSCGNKVPVQKMLLRLKTLDGHEVNHWTDLDATLANVPADKFLYVNLLNTDVLLASEKKMEADLRQIVQKCTGRRYQVVATALEKVHEDMNEDIRQTQRWLSIAKRVFARN